ncbi:Hypp284 [Branchiostoma lanceolatum]|uniref:Hypp284 protein n=1 Tax=Branchiostoma lanceolatum TaxID=7740 RepID=A0A8J9V8B7_BRALA|nr:Hypp284 [Branchiostoma lanceolatum]
MFLQLQIFWSDLSVVISLMIFLFIVVIGLLVVRASAKESSLISQRSPAETINTTTFQGDAHGNITISTGSGSTVNVNSCPQGVQGQHRFTGVQECTIQKSSQNPQRNSRQHEKANRSLVPVLPKSVGKPQRLNTKTQVSCRSYIDKLAQLSAEGKVTECHSTIDELLKTEKDPDCQVSLRHAASLNAIYKGDFKKANHILRGTAALIPDTENGAEHRLWWSRLKSVAKLRMGNYNMGIEFAKDGLCLLETVAPGCISAWLLTSHAWFLTKKAAGQHEDEDKQYLVQKAEKDYLQAIENAESEHPKQMLYFQSRLPQFGKICLALLYLGCGESADSSKLEFFKDVSVDNIRKAKNLIAAVDEEGAVCNLSLFLLMVAKTCLHYRLGSFQQAYDLALEAKDFATDNSFGGFVVIADSIAQYLKKYL